MIIGLLFVLHFLHADQDPYCQIYGRMYQVEDAAQAQFIVYEETSEAFADVIVYEQQNKLYADKPGLWFFEDRKEDARYNIYFTANESEAHFSVFFTDFESFAGCNQ